MNKIVTLNKSSRFSIQIKKGGKTVGLIVGSFDIIHMGHINLFRYARKHVSHIIVGLDNDRTIKLVKGKTRPINNYKKRSELLSDLIYIDKIFEIKKVSHYDSEEALNSYREIVKKISPTHIFTHMACDKHWRNKQRIAKELKINFLMDKSKKITNSGKIIKILSSEL